MPEPRRYSSPFAPVSTRRQGGPRRYSSPTPEGEATVAAVAPGDPSGPGDHYTPAPLRRPSRGLGPTRRYSPQAVPAAPQRQRGDSVLTRERDLTDPQGAAERVLGISPRRRYSMTRDPAQVFSRSLDIVFGLEGGYADHPADKGGRTVYGISERAYPELWKNGTPTKDQAAEAYKALWRDSGAERVAGLQAPGADRLATALFDAAVHHGPQRAAILLQRAAGAGIKQDGTLGPKTLEQIEARLRHDTRGKSVIADLAKERTRFFNRIVQRDPSQRTFLAGWNERLVRLHDRL